MPQGRVNTRTHTNFPEKSIARDLDNFHWILTNSFNLPCQLGPTFLEWNIHPMTEINGTAGNDRLEGTSQDDTIKGGSGADTIIGDDDIDGGHDDDVLEGGSGDDLIEGDAGDDIIIGNVGDDTIFGDSAGDPSDIGNDFIFAGAGEDKVDAGPGNDTVLAGTGDDYVKGNSGDDILVGEAGDDILYGGAGNDKVDGRRGDDTLSGDEGNDALHGGSGADTLSGGSGDDQLFGDTLAFNPAAHPSGYWGSSSTLRVENASEIPIEVWWIKINGDTVHYHTTAPGRAIDQSTTQTHSWLLRDTDGNDLELIEAGTTLRVFGAEGFDDTLEVGDGNDLLYGQLGNDTLKGGAGDDALWGAVGMTLCWGAQAQIISTVARGRTPMRSAQRWTTRKPAIEALMLSILHPAWDMTRPTAFTASRTMSTLATWTPQNSRTKW